MSGELRPEHPAAPYAPQGHPLPRPCCRMPTIASRAERLDPSPGAQGQQPASQLRLPGPASPHQSQSQCPKGGRWNARRGSASGRLGGQRPAGARGQHDRQRVGCERLLAAGRGRGGTCKPEARGASGARRPRPPPLGARASLRRKGPESGAMPHTVTRKSQQCHPSKFGGGGVTLKRSAS